MILLYRINKKISQLINYEIFLELFFLIKKQHSIEVIYPFHLENTVKSDLQH